MKKIFLLLFLVLGYSHFGHVKASDVQQIDITTDISYILSNLAPSCANLDYDGDGIWHCRVRLTNVLSDFCKRWDIKLSEVA